LPQHAERKDKGANCQARRSTSQKTADRRSLYAKWSIENTSGPDCYTEDTITTNPRAKAFQELKKRISSQPILRLPDVSQPFILQTDASHLGVGAVLLQEDTAGEKRSIAFASRKLLPRESRYWRIERECLAITWGVKKFQYLYGTEFILETDHQPLQYLRRAKFQNGRLMRWALALQPYRFLLRAIRGRDNVGADCLSRNPL